MAGSGVVRFLIDRLRGGRGLRGACQKRRRELGALVRGQIGDRFQDGLKAVPGGVKMGNLLRVSAKWAAKTFFRIVVSVCGVVVYGIVTRDFYPAVAGSNPAGRVSVSIRITSEWGRLLRTSVAEVPRSATMATA